jgi:hypothetical protein
MRKRLLLAALSLIFGCEEVQPPAPPQFSALSFTEIGPNSARVNAQLERLGDALIQEHGFVVHEDSSTLDVLNGSKLGSVQRSTPVPVTMSSVTSGLKPNTPYYAAAYALVNDAPVLGKIYSFRTSAIVQPGIRTDAADNINPISARIKGTLLSKGTHDISEYGLVYATAENPTTALTTKHRVSGNVTNFPLAFTYTAPNLIPATTYHFRAYVIANGVTSYGQNLSFRTAAVTQPSVQTDQTSEITTSTAVLHGRVTAAGTYPITERGIVWGTGANPTTANSKASHAGNVSSFPSTYSVTAQNLAMNTTYNYRAYVIANGVTTYGENKTFKTLNLVLPQIRTDAVRPSATFALAFGVITAKGSHPITEYGIVYGSGVNPTTGGNKKTQAGDVAAVPHSYNFTLDNLSPGNTYYYRAYAIMNGQTVYGENLSFRTTDAQRPVVRTDEAKPATNRATAFGTLVSGGTFPITEYGIVLSSGRNPTVNDRKSGINGNVTTFPTRFSMDIDDLNAVARYYYRAFVISNGEVIYGNEAEFTTGYDAPVLTTSAATNVTFTSATLNGTISSPGSFPITEAGIVWATTNNPTTANNKLVHNVSGVSYPYRFSINATTIPRLTALYCRTYVITNGQTYYGNTVSFTTNR